MKDAKGVIEKGKEEETTRLIRYLESQVATLIADKLPGCNQRDIHVAIMAYGADTAITAAAVQHAMGKQLFDVCAVIKSN